MVKRHKESLTGDVLRALRAAPGRRPHIYDSRVEGLGLYVTAAGTKKFFLQRSLHGEQRKWILGTWSDARIPDMTIGQARKKAEKYIGLINDGIDPEGKKRAFRSGAAIQTFGHLFTEYFENWSRVHKKTWAQDERAFKRYLKEWKNRRLDSITRSAVRAKYAQLVDEAGVATANRTHALISGMFTYAIREIEAFDGDHPALRVRTKKSRPRQRSLTKAEFPAFFRAVCSHPSRQAREAVLLFLFTGMRPINVLGARWPEFNLEDGVWNIPDTKTGDPHSLPLTQPALEILVKRHEDFVWARNRMSDIEAGAGAPSLSRTPSREISFLKRRVEGQWVFWGRSGNHLTNIYRPWSQMKTAATKECPSLFDLQIRDLRRTMATWQAKTGANLAITSKSLAHKNLDTTRKVYTVVEIDSMREAMEGAAREMEEMGNGKLQVDGSEEVKFIVNNESKLGNG